MKNIKEELQYPASFDSNKCLLNGSKLYILHLPANIPASKFWSVLVYDSQSRLIIRTSQPWPSVHVNSSQLAVYPDGSVDIWFGPEPPPAKQNNWIQTIPGKNWTMILRLYYPTESWFDKSWRPDEIEEVK